MTDLHIVATMVSKPDKSDALREVLRPAVQDFRNEDGCLGYTLLEDRKRPGRFMTYERWTDEAALQAHMKSPKMRELAPLLPALLEQEITQDYLDVLVSL